MVSSSFCDEDAIFPQELPKATPLRWGPHRGASREGVEELCGMEEATGQKERAGTQIVRSFSQVMSWIYP